MRWLLLISLLILPPSLQAQEDDKGMLTRFLESSLSGAGRLVEVDGLRGAISSQATIEEIRISDSQGLWLTLSGITLNWNRLAVLRGNINVNELSADKIVVMRKPVSEPDPSLPSAEASPFALPELPVSIDIQKLSATRIELGEEILGQPVVLSLDTRLVLKDGAGDVALKATRLGGPEGKFILEGAFSNLSRQLRIDLDAREAADGIIANLVRLPGAPAIDLTVTGDGPIDSFAADIRLSSAGQERLAGQVAISAQPAVAPQTQPTRIITADISGDMAPLFTPEYREFFGNRVALNTRALLHPDGRTELENLTLSAAALDLSGTLVLAANGLPQSFDIRLNMAAPGGGAILLPVSGANTWLDTASLAAEFDADNGERWTLSGKVDGFRSGALDLGQLSLDGNGIIRQQTPRRVSAALSLDVSRLRMANPDLAQAVGEEAAFTGNLFWQEGEGIRLTAFDFASDGLRVAGDARVSGPGDALAIDGRVRLLTPSIARFSGLAQRDLGGGITAELAGQFSPLSGAFDIDLSATARDLSIGDPRFDTLAKGDTTLALSVKRDFDGLFLRNAELHGNGFDLSAKGDLDSANGTVTLAAQLDDTATVLEGVSGPATLKGTATLTSGDWAFRLNATAPGQIAAKVDGALPGNGPLDARFDMTMGAVETFVPALPGAARIKADLRQLDTGWRINLDATGPFDSRVTGAGTVDTQGSNSAFKLSGAVPLAAANRQLAPNSLQGMASFDLRLVGAASLGNISGTISTSGARLALPALRAAFTEINSTITLSEGNAGIALDTAFSGGGNVSVNGSVGLAAPFNANLPIRLTNLAYRDGQFLETVVDGPLLFAGPLTGGGRISGDLTLGQTNIRISSSALAGVGGIPEIAHIGEPQPAQQTRRYAGLIKEVTATQSPSGPPIGLELDIQTGERISVRGMGLNADFGGAVQLRGTTQNTVTQGELSLIRGRMDFLTKTFEIDEGLIRLEGDFVPWMRVQATSEQTDATVRIILVGRLDDPRIILESDPELPEDEVLSQLLFGRDLSSISGLQAAQLAVALASLSGNGPTGPRLGSNTGLDELSLTFDEDGTPGLRAGKYINENIYTEVEVDSEGTSALSLNLDVTDNLTVKGRVDSDSDSGIGLFFQRDY